MPTCLKIWSKFVHNFLSNVVDRQTDRQTDKHRWKHDLFPFAEVVILLISACHKMNSKMCNLHLTEWKIYRLCCAVLDVLNIIIV